MAHFERLIRTSWAGMTSSFWEGTYVFSAVISYEEEMPCGRVSRESRRPKYQVWQKVYVITIYDDAGSQLAGDGG